MGLPLKGLALLFGLASASGCNNAQPASSGAGAVGSDEEVAQPAQPVVAEWYAEKRDLYHGIPVALRFSPASKELAAEVWRYLQRIDDHFNDYRDDSEVARINATPGPTRIEISAEMAEAVKLSLEAHKLTQGLFDVTIRPLRQVWKLAAKAGHQPSEADITAATALIGSHKLSLSRRELSIKGSKISLDFGGIIKGIAADRAAQMLRAGGARAFLVQVGGKTVAFGRSPRGRPHIIGIEDPRQPAREWTQIQGSGVGICGATSSNAHRAIRIRDRTYYHIFDPREGRPVPGHVLAVSVVFRELGRCWLADALSTACSVMKPDRALKLVEQLGGHALILTEKNGITIEHKSKQWEGLEYVRTKTE